MESFEVKKITVSDADSILKFFNELPDPRCATNRKHLLGEIIVICICAVVAGADGPQAIGMWAESQEAWLRKVLSLPNGIPSHDTIGRVLSSLKPAAFQECFARWTSFLCEQHATLSEAPQAKHIAIDGKALRRSHDRQNNLGPLFLVSAWSVECGISLGQLATEEKSNEITAIPELLKAINVEKAVVTIDAAGCQKNIAKQIVDGGGDYVLALKGNQGNIHKDVEAWISKQMENGFADVNARTHEVTEKSHGRKVTIWYTQLPVPNTLNGRDQWTKLKSIGVAVRHCEENDKNTYDTRYYLSSLPMGVKRFANAVRGHWAIENSLHWCLDVTFREDESRLRNRVAGDNMAWLKRFAIGLLKQTPSKVSVAMRRRIAGWNVSFLTKVLGIPIT